MHRIAHIENGVVVNVSVASSKWLAENQSDTILECSDEIGIGFTYDSEMDVFVAPAD
jgi:hypothetical protein